MSGIMVVTGGSQGIGAATARLAAGRGYKVALSYRSGAEYAAAVVAEITRAGGVAIAIQADATDERATEALFAQVDRELGPVTALVNNAGTTGPIRKLDAIDGLLLDEMMRLNVTGCFIALREAVKRMATDLGGAGGAIVNVSSRASEIGGANEFVHYAATKGAIDSFTIGASRELGGRGIRLNAVNPGMIETEIHAKAGDAGRTTRAIPVIPLGRVGTADEVAKVILWLLSDEASYVTGALVPIGGGR
jgi:NAD(P)-dependent dehydrogenase (short-subunit alcohol dehydrogenase family)